MAETTNGCNRSPGDAELGGCGIQHVLMCGTVIIVAEGWWGTMIYY